MKGVKVFIRLIQVFFAFVLGGVIAAGSALAVFTIHWGRTMPDYRLLDSWKLGSTTKVYARDHTLIATLTPKLPGGGRVNRTLVNLEQISPYMTAAAVTSEDRRFFEHYGLDPYGFARNFLRLVQGDDVQGGSTLTNQLIKNTLLGDLKQARTLERKIKEWFLSLQVERTFTKDEILQNYLNVIYWGDGGKTDIVGIHGAAKAYFGKDPRDLNLAESVYLASLIPNPARYFDYKAMRPLMEDRFNRMVEDGWITIEEARKAKLEPLQPKGWQVNYDVKGNIIKANLVNRNAKNLPAVVTERAPHFIQQVEKELLERFGYDTVYGSGGLTVYTSLDLQAQNAVEKASRDARLPLREATLGAVLLDPFTGQVLGMVGQKIRSGQKLLEWNNAAQGQRQVGSSIKPILYTLGIEKGLNQDHTEYDGPGQFKCGNGCAGGWYKPNNFGYSYTYRNMPLREALDKSLNLPTVRLADQLGLPAFFDKLKQLELPIADDVGLAAAIGAIETTPLKMAAAYAPFVNGGIYYKPTFLTHVITPSGQVLYDSSRDKTDSHRVWSPQTAFVGLDFLQGVVNDLGEVEGGLSWRSRIAGWPVGGKTGTTNSVKDIWFMGVTPKAVGAVWSGKQEGGAMPNNVYSGDYMPPIWREMMVDYLKGKQPTNFDVPDGIGYRYMGYRGGTRYAYVARQNVMTVPHTDPEGYLPHYTPLEDYPRETDGEVVAIDSRTGLLADEFTPAESIVMRRITSSQKFDYAPESSP